VPLFDLFWTMLWFFLFVAWIWLLISVYGDIFRSSDLGGGGKALWTIFVLLLPYLGVFVYLLARGGSMHEREAQRSAQAQQAAEAYIRQVAGQGPSAAEELTKLTALRDQGALSAAEFETAKAKLLA
jgi:hypothetical protein